jgi:hypothetical protein
MEMPQGGGGHLPSPTAADIGRTWLGRLRRAAVLERFTKDGWVPYQRFGSIEGARTALDEAIARGVEPDHLRVNEVGPSTGARIAVTAAVAMIALLAAWWLYIMVIG